MNTKFLTFLTGTIFFILQTNASPLEYKASLIAEEGALSLGLWIQIPRMDLVLPIWYTSRSIETGLFGLGWCSPLDLRSSAKDSAWLDACGAVIKLSEFQKLYGLTALNWGPLGRLETFQTSNKITYKVIYGIDTSPKMIVTIDGRRKITLIKDPDTGLITSLLTDGPQTEFHHFGSDLVQVQQGHQSLKMSYNALSNLVEISNSKKKLRPQTFSYDDNQDLLLSMKTEGFLEKYTYSTKLTPGGFVETSVVTHHSSSRKKTLVPFKSQTFHYTQTKNGELIPKRDSARVSQEAP